MRKRTGNANKQPTALLQYLPYRNVRPASDVIALHPPPFARS